MKRRVRERQGCPECGRVGQHEPGCRLDMKVMRAKVEREAVECVIRISEFVNMPIEDLALLDPETVKTAIHVIDKIEAQKKEKANAD